MGCGGGFICVHGADEMLHVGAVPGVTDSLTCMK